MYPTLEDKEVVIALSTNLPFIEAKKGSIVTVDSVLNGENIVKRVIATGNDVVEIQNNKVYVNGTIIDEPYLKQEAQMENMKVEVPNGYVFLLGDNREVSNDSRYFGCISSAEISGIFILGLKN